MTPRRRYKPKPTPDSIVSQGWVVCRICSKDAPSNETTTEWTCPTHGVLDVTWADMIANFQRMRQEPGRFHKIHGSPRNPD